MGHGRQNPTSGVLYFGGKYPLRQKFIAVGQQICRGKPQCSTASLASCDATGKMNASIFHLRLAQNAQGPQCSLLPLRETNQGLCCVKNGTNLARTCASGMLDGLPMSKIN